MPIARFLSRFWSTTRFESDALTAYAATLMVEETRAGLLTLSALAALLLGATAAIVAALSLDPSYFYTYAVLAVLSLHIFLFARRVHDIGSLNALGMTLLTIAGAALVLLAHRHAGFGSVLFASVVLLFMLIPLVPWGLREASLVATLIYTVFTASTVSRATPFSRDTLVTLQFFMLVAFVVSLVLVMRTALVRRHDVIARFELESSRRRMEQLSYEDPLTGAWNRRYLATNYPRIVAHNRELGVHSWFVVLDIDQFKRLNDTYGHGYGDWLLQAVTAAFRSVLTDQEPFVRMGGDEFAALMRGADPRARIEQAIDSFQARASGAGRADDEIPTLSVGVARVDPSDVGGLDAAYRRADEATYRAKRAPGNRIVALEKAS